MEKNTILTRDLEGCSIDPYRRSTFKPGLNPYVAKIQDHKDIILTYPSVAHPDSIQFDNLNLPRVLDIGCGAGNFLRDYAINCPNINFIGIELRFKRLVKAARKFKKHNIRNIRLLQARAEEVDRWFNPGSLKEININFPDPWPKKRQQKHRFVNIDYLRIIRTLLEKDGHFVFKTDHLDYFLNVTKMTKQLQSFDIIEYSEDLHHSVYYEENITTEFELLFKNKGIPVFYLRTAIRQP